MAQHSVSFILCTLDFAHDGTDVRQHLGQSILPVEQYDEQYKSNTVHMCRHSSMQPAGKFQGSFVSPSPVPKQEESVVQSVTAKSMYFYLPHLLPLLPIEGPFLLCRA